MMKSPPDNVTKWLRIVLYHLFHARSPEEWVAVWDSLSDFRANHREADVGSLKNALCWALNNPQTDYSKLMPGLDIQNHEIQNYLVQYEKEFRTRVLQVPTK